MDTSWLGPSLRPSKHIPSSGLLLQHLTWAPEQAVITRLSAVSAVPLQNIYIQSRKGLLSLLYISRLYMLSTDKTTEHLRRAC